MAVDIERLLEEGKTVSFTPIGNSMLPLFRDRRDSATVAPCEAYKRGDVALYRRIGDKLVLHRIVKVRDDRFWFTGDWQWEIEGPLKRAQILGKMVAFERSGKHHETSEPLYRFIFAIWLSLRPLRPAFIKIATFIRFFPKGRTER